MLKLNLARAPYWLDLGHGVRLHVEPLTTALMMAARADQVVEALPETAGQDEPALAMAQAVAGGRCWTGKGSAMPTAIRCR